MSVIIVNNTICVQQRETCVYQIFLIRNFDNLLFKSSLQIERRKTKHFNRERSHSKIKNIAKTIDKTIDARRKVANKINQSKNQTQFFQNKKRDHVVDENFQINQI